MNRKVCQTRELSSSGVTIYFVVSNDYTIFFKDEKLDEFQIANDEPCHEFSSTVNDHNSMIVEEIPASLKGDKRLKRIFSLKNVQEKSFKIRIRLENSIVSSRV